jgi:hypothetical protein
LPIIRLTPLILLFVILTYQTHTVPRDPLLISSSSHRPLGSRQQSSKDTPILLLNVWPSSFPEQRPRCLPTKMHGGRKPQVPRTTDNKGPLGMFAQRSLGIGKVILTKLPVLTIPTLLPNVFQTSGFASDASTAPRADKYEKMFKPLSPAVKRGSDRCSRRGAPGNASLYKTLVNPLAVSLLLPSTSEIGGSDSSLIHGGIFLKTIRCNHRSVHTLLFEEGSIN